MIGGSMEGVTHMFANDRSTFGRQQDQCPSSLLCPKITHILTAFAILRVTASAVLKTLTECVRAAAHCPMWHAASMP